MVVRREVVHDVNVEIHILGKRRKSYAKISGGHKSYRLKEKDGEPSLKDLAYLIGEDCTEEELRELFEK